jgi:hypothetical protein
MDRDGVVGAFNWPSHGHDTSTHATAADLGEYETPILPGVPLLLIAPPIRTSPLMFSVVFNTDGTCDLNIGALQMHFSPDMQIGKMDDTAEDDTVQS